MLATIFGTTSLLVWLYLLLARGGFWRVKKHLGAVAALGREQRSCRVAFVVPARNEAEFIGQSITSLLNQSGNHSIHIFLSTMAAPTSLRTWHAGRQQKPESLPT